MEKTMVEKIAKTYKIDLKQYTHVITSVNDKMTKLFVTFANQLGAGMTKVYVDEKTITMSVSALYKRCECVYDYETNGWQDIWW